MTEIIAFVKAHLIDFVTIGTAIVTAASAIANLTPTDTDNKIVAALSKAINWLALNFKK
jgi:hypothetical protein